MKNDGHEVEQLNKSGGVQVQRIGFPNLLYVVVGLKPFSRVQILIFDIVFLLS